MGLQEKSGIALMIIIGFVWMSFNHISRDDAIHKSLENLKTETSSKIDAVKEDVKNYQPKVEIIVPNGAGASVSGLPKSETDNAPSIGEKTSTIGYSVLGAALNKNALHHKEAKNILQSYLDEFAPIAQTHHKKYGIPASIKLAQALHESNVGKSKLAINNNNHFGVKCFSNNCKKGHCSNATDDTHKDFFRNYKSAWRSYNAHSEFLQKGRYKHLQDYGTNYKKWAHGLKEAGYATDKRYAYKLIRIIEKLDLTKYDKEP